MSSALARAHRPNSFSVRTMPTGGPDHIADVVKSRIMRPRPPNSGPALCDGAAASVIALARAGPRIGNDDGRRARRFKMRREQAGERGALLGAESRIAHEADLVQPALAPLQ